MNLRLPLFLVFEGIDGSGKSTLCGEVYKHFVSSGLPVLKLYEPTDGEWGRQIRDILKSGKMPDARLQVKLFLLDREDDSKRNILPAINDRKMIIMDRYYYSNAAYQGAMGLNPWNIVALNREKEFPVPDRVYLLDISPEDALRRVTGRNKNAHDRDIFEQGEFLTAVRKIYHEISDEKFLIIDGSLPVSESLRIIIDDITNNFGAHEK